MRSVEEPQIKPGVIGLPDLVRGIGLAAIDEVVRLAVALVALVREPDHARAIARTIAHTAAWLGTGQRSRSATSTAVRSTVASVGAGLRGASPAITATSSSGTRRRPRSAR